MAWSFFSTAHAEDGGEIRCGEGSIRSVHGVTSLHRQDSALCLRIQVGIPVSNQSHCQLQSLACEMEIARFGCSGDLHNSRIADGLQCGLKPIKYQISKS